MKHTLCTWLCDSFLFFVLPKLWKPVKKKSSALSSMKPWKALNNTTTAQHDLCFAAAVWSWHEAKRWQSAPQRLETCCCLVLEFPRCVHGSSWKRNVAAGAWPRGWANICCVEGWWEESLHSCDGLCVVFCNLRRWSNDHCIHWGHLDILSLCQLSWMQHSAEQRSAAGIITELSPNVISGRAVLWKIVLKCSVQQPFRWSFHNPRDFTSCGRFAKAWQLSRQTSPETGLSLIYCDSTWIWESFLLSFVQHGRSPEESYCTNKNMYPRDLPLSFYYPRCYKSLGLQPDPDNSLWDAILST